MILRELIANRCMEYPDGFEQLNKHGKFCKVFTEGMIMKHA